MMPIPLPTPSSRRSWQVSGTPLLPRLALEPTMARTGMFDGAWWPRTADARAELPDLITALGAHLGPILRVGLDTVAWRHVPRSVTVNGLVVKIGLFAAGGGTISLTRGFQDHFLLLVVPPGADPRTADAAMAGAAETGNRTPAAELLTQGLSGVVISTVRLGPEDRAETVEPAADR
ncbi:DUF5994 family protein [Kitasatospora sp. NE20-6]|uniref:DUF5994 family protein n=1 Tax=Kitasatospora sp. NE20-6 TaxID=2859066 RepID=UPI0038B3EC26